MDEKSLRDQDDHASMEPEVSASKTASTGTISIGDLARAAGVSLRAIRFYQDKGLLTPRRDGHGWLFGDEDRERLGLILQGKRLGFTLTEIRDMLSARGRGGVKGLPMTRKKCVEQIKLLERQRRDIETAVVELRQIYTDMYAAPGDSRSESESAA
jgi:DNA-binding transcriptional MerR regulator